MCNTAGQHGSVVLFVCASCCHWRRSQSGLRATSRRTVKARNGPRRGATISVSSLGVTDSDGDKGFSVGLDYERRLSRGFGIGGVIEYTGNDYRYGLVAASFKWHPWKELKLFAARAWRSIVPTTAAASCSASVRNTASPSERASRSPRP